jgi:DNA-binding NarL/FixJ family response regulator
MENIQVLIADDHQMFREGLQILFSSIPGMEVVGEAATGEEAIALSASLQPDIVLMDINMPDMNGVDATRIIVSTSPHIGVLMFTMYDDDDSVFAAMKAGARGYILKGAKQDETQRAIRAVVSGEAIFSQAIARRMMRYFSTSPQRVPESSYPFPELSERERELLTLIAQGQNNGGIAQCLNISHKTVRNHISNIFNKMQVADRAQAIARARDAGLGEKS